MVESKLCWEGEILSAYMREPGCAGVFKEDVTLLANIVRHAEGGWNGRFAPLTGALAVA